MKKLLPCLLILAFTSITAVAKADVTKMGYVQIDKIMQSPISLEAGKKLQNEFSPRNADLDKLKKQIADKQASMDKDLATMSETDRRKRSQELSTMQIDFERKQRELSEDFNQRKNEEMSNLQDRVNKAVATVAANEGYDLIFYGSAAYVGKDADITDKIIKAINATNP
ncbi:OmpH family outer membrane protein [Methyloradius palustris]|nr:OmpH family outer membrane protein [Methyloradius palustris]